MEELCVSDVCVSDGKVGALGFLLEYQEERNRRLVSGKDVVVSEFGTKPFEEACKDLFVRVIYGQFLC